MGNLKLITRDMLYILNPGVIESGVSFNMTIQARDSAGRIVTAYNNVDVSVAFSDANGTPIGTAEFHTLVNGTVTFAKTLTFSGITAPIVVDAECDDMMGVVRGIAMPTHYPFARRECGAIGESLGEVLLGTAYNLFSASWTNWGSYSEPLWYETFTDARAEYFTSPVVEDGESYTGDIIMIDGYSDRVEAFIWSHYCEVDTTGLNLSSATTALLRITFGFTNSGGVYQDHSTASIVVLNELPTSPEALHEAEPMATLSFADLNLLNESGAFPAELLVSITGALPTGNTLYFIVRPDAVSAIPPYGPNPIALSILKLESIVFY